LGGGVDPGDRGIDRMMVEHELRLFERQLSELSLMRSRFQAGYAGILGEADFTATEIEWLAEAGVTAARAGVAQPGEHRR
jgi:hypothetical protein